MSAPPRPPFLCSPWGAAFSPGGWARRPPGGPRGDPLVLLPMAFAWGCWGAGWLGSSATLVSPRWCHEARGFGLLCARGAGAELLGTSASLRSFVSSLWGRIALCSRGRCGVAGQVGFSALTCVFHVGSNCDGLAEPARSGWAGRLLCARLCLGCGVELRYACGNGAEWLGLSVPLRVVAVPLPGRLVCCCEAGVEWLGTSASLLSLAFSLWSRIALCSRGRCGVAGPVGLSALACVVFPVGSNCIMLAGPVRSGWACRPLRAHFCLPRGFGLHFVRVSASLRSLVSSLWGRTVLRLRRRRGVAGPVGLSAFACVLVAGSDCARQP